MASKRSRYLGSGAAGAALLAAALAYTGSWEGDKLRSYRDVGGVWTACMGVTEGIGPNMTFTVAQCADLNRQKLVEHEQRLLACAPEMWGAPAKTYVAINDWAYNVGTGAACRSTLIKYARKGQWRQACEQLSRWVYVKGAVIRGLVNRRINDAGGRISERTLCLEGL